MTANSWSLSGKLGCLCVVLATLAIVAPVQADPVLTILPDGYVAESVNDSGVVVGEAGPYAAFLRTRRGRMTIFKALDDAVSTLPLGINNSGVISGGYTDHNGFGHGFVRDVSGAITSFDAPNAGIAGTYGASINANGVIAGYSVDQSVVRHGFVRAEDGTITVFDVPNATETWVTGINDDGEIVGTWNDSISHGFVRSADGTITSFDAPDGAMGTVANAINGAGLVTGSYTDQAEVVHGYIRQPDGTLATFDVSPLLAATAINARGTVAGAGGLTPKHKYLGFVRDWNGSVTSIAAPPYDVYPFGINKHGVVAGYLHTVVHHLNKGRGFIWTP